MAFRSKSGQFSHTLNRLRGNRQESERYRPAVALGGESGLRRVQAAFFRPAMNEFSSPVVASSALAVVHWRHRWSGPRALARLWMKRRRFACAQGGGLIREEVWQSDCGEVVRYNLAFICHQLCATDHGRVLGYDNQHDHHHRHFMGRTEPFQYAGYDVLLDRFLAEVEILRRETR